MLQASVAESEWKQGGSVLLGSVSEAADNRSGDVRNEGAGRRG